MEADLIQSTILAIIQGLTEFLPISSSAHLILPSQVFGWQDQGLAFDVAVHVGTLLAVVLYLRKDLLLLVRAWLTSLTERSDNSNSEHAQLAWCLLLASLPAAIAGFLGRSLVSDYARNAELIAFTSIFFGLLLWWADARLRRDKNQQEISWQQGLLIGLAQALAIIPGTSRSGITMTAALLLGFSRQAAARFSFLLAVPIIAGSGLLQALDLLAQGVPAAQWLLLAYAAVVSAGVALLCIHYFLQLIERTGFLPFVIYRVILGLVLLVIVLV